MSEYRQSGDAQEAAGLRLAIAKARYNEQVTSGLATGAIDYLEQTGAEYQLFETPGAFELPLVARKLIEAGFDGVVALGAVVDGETDHYEHVAHRVSEGLMQVMLDTGKPVAFGVLTVRDEQHALVRSAPGPGNKGAEAAAAVVETALLIREIHRGAGID